jgi:hypothetical protein
MLAQQDQSENALVIIRASAIYILLWIPTMIISGLVTLAGVMAFSSAPMWSALSFLLAFPVALVGLKSFRASAISVGVLLAWDVVATTWPHVSITGLFNSVIDVLLLCAAVLATLVAALSPFSSIADFVDYLRFG